VTRTQHIEIFQADVFEQHLVVCHDACDHSKARWVKRVGYQQLHLTRVVTGSEWRWRHRAANGAIVAVSPHGYHHPRDAVKGLELAHPGYRMDREALFLEPDGQGRAIMVNIPEEHRHRFAARRVNGIPEEVLR
jgi:hypothetical protein